MLLISAPLMNVMMFIIESISTLLYSQIRDFVLNSVISRIAGGDWDGGGRCKPKNGFNNFFFNFTY